MKPLADMTREELLIEAARLELVRKLELILHTNWDLKKAVRLALEAIKEALGTASGSLMLLDPDQRLRIWAAVGIDPAIVNEVNRTGIALGEGIAGRVFEQGEPAILNGQKDPAFAALMTRDDILKAACIPLKGKGGVMLGVLNINTTDPKTLGDDEVAILKDIAPSLADALQHRQEVTAVREFSLILQAAEEPTQINWAISRVSILLGLSTVILFRSDTEERNLVVAFDTSQGESITDRVWPLQSDQITSSPVTQAYLGKTVICETAADELLPETLRGKPAVFLPLVTEEGGDRRVLGVLAISPIPPEQAEIGEILASTLALALKSTINLQRAQNFLHGLLGVLALTLEAKSPYTSGHSRRVTEFAVATAQSMELPTDEIETLRRAGMLHDIGKVETPDNILNKPGGLDPDEWKIIKHHTVAGHEILLQASGLAREIAVATLNHHEDEAGGGYPSGVRGADLPRIVQLIRVADAFDAMTSDRSYRKGMPPIQAAFELMRCANRQFNRLVVRHFLVALMKGVEVTISENRVGAGEEQKRLIKLEPADISTIYQCLTGSSPTSDVETCKGLEGKRVEVNPDPADRNAISTELTTFFLPLFSAASANTH